MKMATEFRGFCLSVLVTGLMGGATYWLAQDLQGHAAAVSHEQTGRSPWFMAKAPDNIALARGRKLFLNSCAHCHGEDARGDEGPDLHQLEVSGRYIGNTIKRGIKGEMPSFAKKHSDDEIAALIAYIRSLD